MRDKLANLARMNDAIKDLALLIRDGDYTSTRLDTGEVKRALYKIRDAANIDIGAMAERVRRYEWALAKAAACMLSEDNGISDTVWLANCVTLYEHLVGELSGQIELTSEPAKDREILEQYAQQALKAVTK